VVASLEWAAVVFFFRVVGNAGLAMVTAMALNVYLRAGKHSDGCITRYRGMMENIVEGRFRWLLGGHFGVLRHDIGVKNDYQNLV